MVEFATEKWTQLKMETNERLNKNRIVKKWKENDIVFVLDRLQIPGNPRPLKLRFNPSPYLVVRCLYSTSLLRRISDGFLALYSNDHLKKYSGADPIFATLPAEINKILLNDFQNFLAEDFSTITKFDTMEIPNGIQLYDPSDETVTYEDEEIRETGQDEIINKINRIEPLQDEFSPEEPFDNDTTQIVPTKIDLPARSLIEKDLLDLQNNTDQDQEDDLKQNEINTEQDSDEDDPTEELQGRQLRTKRKKTVKFDPSTFPQRRGPK
jgi:hypothetical protein